MDLHRRWSVLVRMTEAGERLETVRISNDLEYLRAVMARAGEAPEVVLEAAYGWYWAADTLAGLGATVHLAHPLGVKMFCYRRVKNDERDAAELADLLRMGRLPEAWIAPPATRELRELVRHRALCRYRHKAQLISRNVAKLVQTNVQDAGQHEPYSVDESKRLLIQVQRHRLHALWVLLVMLGVRGGSPRAALD
jgi:transposase